MGRLSFHFFLVDGLPAAASIESLPPLGGKKRALRAKALSGRQKAESTRRAACRGAFGE